MTRGDVARDWTPIRFGDLFETLRTVALSRDQLSSDGQFGYVHYGDIHTKWDTYLNVSKHQLPRAGGGLVGRAEEVRDGDLVVVDASEDVAGVGKTIEIQGVGGQRIVAGLHTIHLRPRNGVIAPGFAGLLQYTPEFREQVSRVAAGLKVYGLSKSLLAKVSVSIPPHEEQEAIVEILTDVMSLTDCLDGLITKKRHLKAAVSDALLSGAKRLPGFMESWGETPLGDVCRLGNSRMDPRRMEPGTFCIELEHLESGTGRLTGGVVLDGTESHKTMFSRGDVLFGKLRAYLRKTWFADCDGLCSTEIWVMKSDPSRLLPEYLAQIVRTDGFIAKADMTHGTHMPRSEWAITSRFPLILPSVQEQRAIAELLSDMDAEIEAIEKRFAKTQDLKRGMAQELLTGRTRLV